MVAHSGPILALCFSSDGKYLASYSERDLEVRVWKTSKSFLDSLLNREKAEIAFKTHSIMSLGKVANNDKNAILHRITQRIGKKGEKGKKEKKEDNLKQASTSIVIEDEYGRHWMTKAELKWEGKIITLFRYVSLVESADIEKNEIININTESFERLKKVDIFNVP